jgi:hypothetical protein
VVLLFSKGADDLRICAHALTLNWHNTRRETIIPMIAAPDEKKRGKVFIATKNMRGPRATAPEGAVRL